MKRYLLAVLAFAILAGAVAVLIGGDDGRTDDSGDADSLRRWDAAGVAHVGYPLSVWPQPTPVPTPTPTPTAAPVPGPTDVAEPPELPPAPASPASSEPALTESGWPSEPPPKPTGTLVHNVQLTIYSCRGDSTGAYCPGDPTYCGGTVYRGVAACRWAWACGQRFRIVGDPLDMVYTCGDRGGAVTGIDVWFYDYYAEGRPWRVQVRASYDDATVTVELLP